MQVFLFLCSIGLFVVVSALSPFSAAVHLSASFPASQAMTAFEAVRAAQTQNGAGRVSLKKESSIGELVLKRIQAKWLKWKGREIKLWVY